jgi:3-hydroxyisobutyrate dehydrogenase
MPRIDVPANRDPWPSRVGFIGLGDMGGAMACTLARTGVDLVVYDIRPDAARDVVSAGATVAVDIAALAAQTELISICVVDDGQLNDVVGEIVAADGPCHTVLVHSAVSSEGVREVAARCAARGITTIDAPVSGGRAAAESGALTVILGGARESVDAVVPLLARVASKIHFVGDVGAAQSVKMINNVMTLGNHMLAVEAMDLAVALGLDEAIVMDVANTSTGRSWVTETWGFFDDLQRDHPLAGTDEMRSLMTKEQWHALTLARHHVVSMPVTAASVQASPITLVRRAAAQ